MQVREVPWDNADAVELRNGQSRDLSARYDSPVTLNEPAPDGVVSMSVLYIDTDDGELPVGCAALVDVTGAEDVFGAARTVEMRRVYVLPEYRGRGYSHALIDETHRIAVERGFEQIVLVSGTLQPESVGLYRSRGYEELQPYGMYQQFETSLFFVKRIVDDTH
ncbi:GNAT family N-acetyltransferase [Timonella sp. A28]|uniref:GNAT family N-acetyltransferase n=1 Tax=Timonella sp. A28 TaxID=3442640 RepID=UPI003EB8F048